MRFQSLALAFGAMLLFAPPPVSAEAACGGSCDTACRMPCCIKEPEPVGSAIDVLMAMDANALRPHAHDVASPRQTAVVWFHRPVWVGQTVLLGKYVIEHDTDRQARGEACTHIYAAAKPTVPVVTFHCTHLEGASAQQDTVVLQALPDGMRKLLRFQFAGESAAHGHPAGH